MLGNSRGRDFDVLEQGDVVLSVRYLNQEDPVECCICGQKTFSHFCVPYYCGAVREGRSEGGYAVACDRCYARWERWSDVLDLLRPFPASKWRPSHGGYPTPLIAHDPLYRAAGGPRRG